MNTGRRKLRYLGYIVAAAVAYAVTVRIHPGAEWLLPWLYMFGGYLAGALRSRPPVHVPPGGAVPVGRRRRRCGRG